MKYLRAVLVAAPAALVFACSSGAHVAATSSGTSAASSSGGNPECPPCVTDKDCATGSRCAQFGGDIYCAPDCTTTACAAGRTCTQVTGAEGQAVQVCVPQANVCGGSMGSGGAGGGTMASSSSSSSSTSGGMTCGSLDGPSVKACCTACMTSGKPCQSNGCYGGWWCNADTCFCQQPPAGPCGTTSASSSTSSASSSTSSSSGGTGGTVGPMGGTIDTLRFGIVGDTRPAFIDDTAGYPTAVIQKIWQDLEAHSPRPAFAVTTGDYMFAKPYAGQGGHQLDLYLAARAAFTNIVFPAMGNHECTGGTASNCYQGSTDGLTNNYIFFLNKMLTPIGQSLPYYSIHVNGTGNAWTSKFVFVAANAWTSAQATWLDAELAKPTTYTFVVRHEGSIATTAPGVTPSAQIMAQHPYTLLLAGHTHTFAYYPSERQVVTGNGGAPLTGGINYGYVVAEQRADGAIVIKEYDYSTNAVQQTFAVKADGTHTQ